MLLRDFVRDFQAPEDLLPMKGKLLIRTCVRTRLAADEISFASTTLSSRDFSELRERIVMDRGNPLSMGRCYPLSGKSGSQTSGLSEVPVSQVTTWRLTLEPKPEHRDIRSASSPILFPGRAAGLFICSLLKVRRPRTSSCATSCTDLTQLPESDRCLDIASCMPVCDRLAAVMPAYPSLRRRIPTYGKHFCFLHTQSFIFVLPTIHLVSSSLARPLPGLNLRRKPNAPEIAF